MHLDENRVTIRERSLPEIMDLALHVIRAGGLNLAVMLSIGCLPFMALNYWLVGHWAATDYQADWPLGYYWAMLSLVVVEIPLASAPATLFLGQTMFQERPNLQRVGSDMLASLPQLLTYQVLLRTLLTLPIITGVVLYAALPYLNEVILLERNPMRARSGGRMTTVRRAIMLHSHSSGELFGRWLLSMAFATALVVAVWMSLWMTFSLFSGYQHSAQIAHQIYLPLAIWIVASYFTVVRFLAYLDLRIRTEGWEVELRLRAEATRLTSSPA